MSSITGCRDMTALGGGSREDEGNENNLLLVNANKANRSEILRADAEQDERG